MALNSHLGLTFAKRALRRLWRTDEIVRLGICAPLALAACISQGQTIEKFKLPGSQPNEHKFQFRDVSNCALCHSGTTNGPADPYFSWQGGMMAQSARDPVFRAALAIANQDLPGSGEFCIRCHSPRGWLEGASTISNGLLLTNDYLHGVSCDVCHHLVDPLSKEAKEFAKQVPPGYGNGMIVVDPERNLRGPYADTKGLKMHPTLASPYHASSELCGNCHNVSNPTLATNVNSQPPHAFGHIERTYSEWALSDFAKQESLQSCQSCHFPRVPGGGKAVHYKSKFGDQHRDYFVSHNAVGGSTWVQDAIYEIWKGSQVDRDALNAGKERARALLKTAATMGLEIKDGKAYLTITNLTGHKLPTGYPEGRRMWVNMRFFRGNRLLGESGIYGEKEDKLELPDVKLSAKLRRGNNPSEHQRVRRRIDVKVPTLLDPYWTRVYECKPGISPEQGKKYGKPPGPSFHFILNDVITKDNRIPPRGYRRNAFAEHMAAPVSGYSENGTPPIQPSWMPSVNATVQTQWRLAPIASGDVEYADGQYWDALAMTLPTGTDRVEMRLMYQSVSWEYLKFLVEENKSDDWGLKLYEAWDKTGNCPPEEIAFAVGLVQ